MHDLKKPSDNQKYVKSLDKISASVAQPLPQTVVVESKQNVRMMSGVEDLTDSQVNIWADSLIVSPIVPLVKPVPHRPMTRSLTNSPAKPTPSSQPRPCDHVNPQQTPHQLPHLSPLQTKPTSTTETKRSSYYLPISPSPSPHAKADCTPLQSTLQSTPDCSPLQSTPDEHTRSSIKKPDCTPLESTPNLSKPDSDPKHLSKTLTKPNYNLGEPAAALTKPHTKSQSRDVGIYTDPSLTLGIKPNPKSSAPKKPSSSSSISECPPPFNPLPLATLGVDELLDFDVGSLYREPEWEVEENDWDASREAEISIVGAHAERGRVSITCVDDNRASDDDSQDEDFTGNEDLLTIMRKFCIQEGFTSQKVKNEKTRYTQKCTIPGYPWRIHCATPKMDVKGMQEIVMRKYRIHIPDHTCWKARKTMKDAIDGKHKEGYKYLAHYTKESKAKNPGSVTFITWAYQGPAKNPIFKHMLICIGPSIAAFK
ncbi:LOW QUALITY PROTEIN: hypothetical protein Cgig2_030765 [Carnegiea gigantea]|uniref:Transposase MuDR plant domain-containing protein n=1 Tax=Carnegiea gigantea TaxID=171969 RepID=A0A9Q1KSI1_9CARY|nr:LOW QUALITY PROTEIN: hypothetical protein Cgig2_030765 [Carnegiea gigantea]